MVRETRHLWIGNLPENAREEQIRELFQRHGRVQGVKMVPDDVNSTSSSKNATVSFIDIKSAAKALRGTYNLGGQSLHIKYYEPNAVPRDIGSEQHENSSPISNGPMGDSLSEPNSNSQSTSATGGHGPSNNNVNSNGPLPGGGNNLGGPYRHQRFPPMQHGQSEESSHFYEQPKGFNRGRGDGHFHSRGRRDHRNYHNRHQQYQERNYNRMSSNWNNYHNENRYAPPESEDRNPGPPPVSHNSSNETGNKVPQRRPESPAGSVSSRHLKRHKSRSVSESGSSDRGSSVGSRSRSGSRSSVSTSVSSSHSRSPGRRGGGQFSRGGSIGSNSSGRFQRNSYSRQRYSRSQLVSRPADSSRAHHNSSRSSPAGASPSSSTSSSPSPHRKIVSNPHSPSRSPSSTKSYSPSRSSVNSGHHNHSSNSSHRRRVPNNGELACAIRIRNLPSRSSDTSLKDGLFHEYKKHGKVSWVRINGQGPARYGIVCFKSAEQATKAVSMSQDKLFFGCKIQVSPYFDGSNRMNGGTDDIISGVDEENRMIGEEDLPTVPYPTRSILINGLDPTINVQELKQAFVQYGEIVVIDIRKVGGNTHAVCEFVDISSAIRAQWGRYVFKTREARISFFRNPATSSLLLDGTANVSEKEVHNHCCQYGAIKKVIMDPSRILGLVQFETISSAQTAIRELRRWVINRKHLHVDFASPVCVGMYVERLKNTPAEPETGLRNSSPATVESLSPSSNPGSEPTIRVRRKFVDESQLERKIHRRKEIDIESGTIQQFADELVSSENSNTTSYSSRAVEFGEHLVENQVVNYRPTVRVNHRHDIRTSPISPDGESDQPESKPPEKSNKASCSSSKIDLSCHETDSAIVTSSSDVICSEKELTDTSVIREFEQTLPNRNDDPRFEDSELLVRNSGTQPVRKFSGWKKPSNVIITVDGVSSTSPEPKAEAVRKVSPDPGIGTSSIPSLESRRILSESVSDPPMDPRKKLIDDQRRRASADSAHPQETTSTRSSSSSDISTVRHLSDDSPTEDLDERPGTPLCDENPDFSLSDTNSFTDSNSSRPRIEQKEKTALGRISLRNEIPLSLPLPEFAKQANAKESGLGHGKSPGSEKKLTNKSPIGSVSVTNNVDSNVHEPSTQVETPENSDKNSVVTLVQSVKSVENSSSDGGTSTNISEVPEQFLEQETSRNSTAIPEDDIVIVPGESSRISDESVLTVDDSSTASFLKDEINDNLDNDDANSASSSDSEGKSSRNSPTSYQLEQRIQQLYEKYDQWSGSRSAIKAATVPNSSLNFNLSSDNSGSKSAETGQPGESEHSSLSTSVLNKPWLSRAKPLSLDNMKHEPSDIVKSLLAKKSVFDEDSKRLENFEEKYDPKALSNINTTNWRQALSRSTSSPASATLLSPLLSPMKPSSLFATTSASTSTNSTSISRSHSHAQPQTSSSSLGLHKVSGPSPSCSPLMKRRESGHGDSLKLDINSKVNPRSSSLSSPASDVSNKSPNSFGTHRIHSQSTVEQQKVPTPRQIPAGAKVKHASVDGITAKVMGSPRTPTSEKEVNAVKGTTVPSQQILQSIKPTHASTLVTTSAPTPPVPHVGIHQGIPRMVERSTSLDSKRCLAGVNAASSQMHPNSVNNVASQSANTNRRPSVEVTYQNQLQPTKESSIMHSKVSLADTTKVTHSPRLESKEISSVNVNETRTKPTPSLTIISQQKEIGDSKLLRYDNMMKVDPGLISHLNEPTVAVVATVQTPVLQQSQKSSGNNASNPDKEKTNGVNNNNNAGKREKDPYLNNAKKGHSSVPSNPQNNNNNNTVKALPSNNVKQTTATTEKKDKISKNSKPEPSFEGVNHHNGNKKKDKNGDPSSSSSQNHKKEKDKEKESSKMKRPHGSQEKEQEVKKVKLDKDSHDVKETKPEPEAQIHISQKSSNSSADRRESVDSIAKAKLIKEKEKQQSEQNTTVIKLPLIEKGESKSEKDHHHHKSKISLSNTSKESKHHHTSEKTSTSINTQSVHKHKEKHESKEKEKLSSKSSVSEEKFSKHSSTNSTDGHNKQFNHQKKEKDSSLQSSLKPKLKDREKEKSKTSTSSFVTSLDSDGAQDLEHRAHLSKKKEKIRTDSSEQPKPTKLKVETHTKKPSGGSEIASMQLTAENSAKPGSNSKGKVKQKRRRIVDSDSDSTTDDEQKHHSIFEVVVDQYVSMYDKVKARSNRACKNILTPQQQKEEQSKHDKLEDSFKQLKKSRAKREEKKRSTSVEERKIGHTSSDNDTHHSDKDSDTESRRGSFSKTKDKYRGVESSDDEEGEVRKSSSSKHSSRPKIKHSSSSGKLLKRPKKQRESSPRTSYLMSTSDQGSEEEQPNHKKQKLSSKHMTSKDTDSDSSSSDSEIEATEKVSSKSSNFAKNKHLQKKISLDIFTESDNSVKSSNKTKKPYTMSSLSSTKPKKEKSSSKQKIDAMKKSLFDYSESSDESSKVQPFSPKKDKASLLLKTSSSSKSKNREDKESKTNRKKESSSPLHHRTSTGLSSSSSLKKEKSKHKDSKSPSLSRRESTITTTEADLFGSMSSSNESEPEVIPLPKVVERPPTPPIVSSSSMLEEVRVPQHKSKHSSERSKQKKHSTSSQRTSESKETEHSAHQSSKSSEKKKRKHHKRSRREEGSEKRSSPPKLQIKTEGGKVDYSSLFNSPPSSTSITGRIDGAMECETFKGDHLFPGLTPPVPITTKTSPARGKENDAVEEGMKSMFSSDEDEEEDASLKIGIKEAIMASEDEKLIPSPTNNAPIDIMQKQLEEKETAAAAKRLEEEIKRNCLFEQDKAIESILMERKSPARSHIDISHIPIQSTPNEVEENAKDNDAAISQEETEDAVAALLGTLGRDDEEEEESPMSIEKATVSHSPPTLRIIEESSPSVPRAVSERSASPSNASPWYAKSPELHIDEDTVVGKEQEEERVPQQTPAALAKTPEEKFDLLKKFTQEFGEVVEDESEKAPDSSQATGSRRNSRQGSTGSRRLSGDVYEFHDSDDEKGKARRAKEALQSPPIPAQIVQPRGSVGSITPPAKSPVSGLVISEAEKVPVSVQSSPIGPPPPPTTPVAVTLENIQHTTPLQVTIPPVEEKVFDFHPPAAASAISPKKTPPSAPHVVLPPAASIPAAALLPRTSIDDTIDHVIRMANLEVSSAGFTSSKPAAPIPRGRSRSKSKDTDDQSSTIAAIISRVARSSCDSPKHTSPSTEFVPPVVVPVEPVPIHQLQKPIIPGLDTRVEMPQAPVIHGHKERREIDGLNDSKTNHSQPPVRSAEEGHGQFSPVISKQDSDKQFLKQQLLLYQNLHQQYADKQPPISFPQFLHQKEGLASSLAIANHHQHQQIMEHVKGEQQKQFQQQHRSEVVQNSPSIPNPAMLSPTGQTKPPIIYTTTTEPFIPPKFPGDGDRARIYCASNVYPMPGMKPQEMLSHAHAGHRGFPEMRHPHPLPPPAVSTNSPGMQQQSQVQAQLVRIPEIPSATTITKVNARNEEQPPRSINVMQQHPSVIFTSAGQGPVIRTSVPTSLHMPMPVTRPNEKYGSQGSPRIEITTTNIVQPPLASPKMGRIPQQFETSQSAQSMQQRIMTSHHIPFDAMDNSSPVPLDLATQSSSQNKDSVSNLSNNSINNNNKLSTSNISASPSSSYLQQSRQGDVRAMHMQRASLESAFPSSYPPHYVNASLQALAAGQSSPTIPFMTRPGSSDNNNKNQIEMPKGMAERPPTAHIIPPHIASPASDRGSSDSPRLVPVYNQRQFFSGTPSQLSISHSPSLSAAAHQQARQTYIHPYAEMEEAAQFGQGPPFYPSGIPSRREPEREEVSEVRATPPPAHSRYAALHHAAELASNAIENERHQAHSPSQPLQGDPLLTLLQKYPIMWQGQLALKNDSAACQMHFVSGNVNVARDSLPSSPDMIASIPSLRISQRMRLEQAQLDGVARKLQTDSEHCMLLALPCGRDHMDVLQQSNNLRNGFITYLQLKLAAGIVNIHHPESQIPAYVIHIFPSCDFANENLAKIAPDLLHGVADIAHLLIVIATV